MSGSMIGLAGRQSARSAGGRVTWLCEVLPDQWHVPRHWPSGCSTGRLGADLGGYVRQGPKRAPAARAGDRAWPTSSATPEATRWVSAMGNPAAIAW